MHRLPTALLLHRTAAGSHYDWLIADPCEPGGRLWTARVGLPSRGWLAAGAFELVSIAAHRRAYLCYEGPVPGGRGTVRRVDEGFVLPRLWRAGRIVLELEMRRVRGRAELRAIGPGRWRGHVAPVS